jgi:hypothetical protein
MLRLIAYGYAVAALFLAALITGVAKAAALHPTLGSPQWALIMAFVFILPLLLPAFGFLAPYVKSIKVSDFEVTFAEIQVTSFSLTSLVSPTSSRPLQNK